MRSVAVLLALAVVLCLPMSASASPASSPLLWLRADAGVQHSSNKVYQWDDQSGNGKHATMPSSSRQPTLVPGALNGYPVIRFGGAQSLNLLNPASPTAFTVFVVGKNSNPSASFNMILGPSGNHPNNQLRWEYGNQALFVGTGNGLPAITSSIGNNSFYHALSATYNGSVMKVYRDGGFVSSHSFTTYGPWTLSSVGAWYSTYFLVGDLAEVLIYSRVLTDSERAQTDSYLSSKYALPPSSACSNGLCEIGESCSTCPWDCGSCPTCDYDGYCGWGESCSTCPSDCGSCSTCDYDYICEYGESASCSDCCGVALPLQADGTSRLQPCEVAY